MDTAKLAKLLQSLKDSGSVSDLAKKMKVNAQSLRGYIRNEGTIPGTAVIKAIAEYMEIPVDELLDLISDESEKKGGSVKDQYVPYMPLSADREIERLKNLPQTEKLRLAQMLIGEAIVA